VTPGPAQIPRATVGSATVGGSAQTPGVPP
jgi:hypothetical protein